MSLPLSDNIPSTIPAMTAAVTSSPAAPINPMVDFLLHAQSESMRSLFSMLSTPEQIRCYAGLIQFVGARQSELTRYVAPSHSCQLLISVI